MDNINLKTKEELTVDKVALESRRAVLQTKEDVSCSVDQWGHQDRLDCPHCKYVNRSFEPLMRQERYSL